MHLKIVKQEFSHENVCPLKKKNWRVDWFVMYIASKLWKKPLYNGGNNKGRVFGTITHNEKVQPLLSDIVPNYTQIILYQIIIINMTYQRYINKYRNTPKCVRDKICAQIQEHHERHKFNKSIKKLVKNEEISWV